MTKPLFSNDDIDEMTGRVGNDYPPPHQLRNSEKWDYIKDLQFFMGRVLNDYNQNTQSLLAGKDAPSLHSKLSESKKWLIAQLTDPSMTTKPVSEEYASNVADAIVDEVSQKATQIIAAYNDTRKTSGRNR